MLAKQQTATLLYAALFGSSLVQAAFPTCITSCVRQNGCPPTDVDCMCKKVSGSFLSDVVVCMNQWCSSDTTLAELVNPIQSSCDIPKSALQSAESKAGFETGSISSSDSDSDSSDDEKPTSTGGSSTAKPSVIMSVGAPYKIDGPSSSTSGPAPTGSATKGSASSVVLSDTTAVAGPAPTASESLLVAATTFTSSGAASTPTSTASSSSSTSSSSSSSSSDDEDSSAQGSDGTPGSAPSGDSTEEGSASTSQASLLAAVLAVGAAMAFGW
ncbi:hypothetical protein F5Y00DRAFT_165230 [Daldinia vernicosa]|uniref:uncharacterized protein n=1 Tax=Daldinia vernicosa TaxID=114800 RepID=UPI002007383E|nr:uncharacterized protein F5Y00DRAFT_165230 [Daldinia vernicosa]KAI0845598.1 hypothetical protein F5Y00DRAFT_165230 [Daldinia vernicosa]